MHDTHTMHHVCSIIYSLVRSTVKTLFVLLRNKLILGINLVIIYLLKYVNVVLTTSLPSILSSELCKFNSSIQFELLSHLLYNDILLLAILYYGKHSSSHLWEYIILSLINCTFGALGRAQCKKKEKWSTRLTKEWSHIVVDEIKSVLYIRDREVECNTKCYRVL